MIVLTEGYGMQGAKWHVTEREASGFSRVYYVTGGSVRYTDANNDFTLEHGHLYIFPTCIPYEMTHDVRDPLVCLWYHFDFFPSIVSSLIDIVPEPTLESLLSALISELKTLTPSIDRRYFMPTYITGNYYTRLVESLEAYILERTSITRTSPDIAEIAEVIRSRCFSRKFKVAKVSELFGYTPEHLIRRFRAHMNMTPYQYVTSLRMAEAVRLLLCDTPISEVAASIGYSESKSFSRAFVSRYGVPPSEYKRCYCHGA